MKQRGTATFSVVAILAISAMLLSAVCLLFFNNRNYSFSEVVKVRSTEAAVGAAQYAIAQVCANPQITSVVYPGTVSPDLTLTITVAHPTTSTRQITVTSAIAGPVSALRRIVVGYDLVLNQVTSWQEQ